jgi:hypothetical protein
MPTAITITEAAILKRVVTPHIADLDPDAARSLLALKFDAATTRHIRQLLQKNNRGTISAEERIALDKYLRVGQFLDLLHAEVRLALYEAAPSS